VNVVGPPVTAALCDPLKAQLIAYHAPETVTGSLKVTDTSASTGTLEVPFAGEVAVTDGARSALQSVLGLTLLRGVGAPAMKSLALLSVSVQPPSTRRTLVVLLGAGVAPGPSKKSAFP
jgi:hypothetical protein